MVRVFLYALCHGALARTADVKCPYWYKAKKPLACIRSTYGLRSRGCFKINLPNWHRVAATQEEGESPLVSTLSS